MKYFVSYVWGSCRTGDRNGGCGTFDTKEEAIAEADSIVADHDDAICLVIEGELLTECKGRDY